MNSNTDMELQELISEAILNQLPSVALPETHSAAMCSWPFVFLCVIILRYSGFLISMNLMKQDVS